MPTAPRLSIAAALAVTLALASCGDAAPGALEASDKTWRLVVPDGWTAKEMSGPKGQGGYVVYSPGVAEADADRGVPKNSGDALCRTMVKPAKGEPKTQAQLNDEARAQYEGDRKRIESIENPTAREMTFLELREVNGVVGVTGLLPFHGGEGRIALQGAATFAVPDGARGLVCFILVDEAGKAADYPTLSQLRALLLSFEPL